MVAIDSIRLERHLAPQRLPKNEEKAMSSTSELKQVHYMRRRRGYVRTVNAMTNATAAESQTQFTGTSCLFTRHQTCENGIAPSLEKAYPIM
jgi:hypothetical protein